MSSQLRCVERKYGHCANLGIPDWKKEFHLHVDASCTVLGAVLMQAGEGEMDHPIAFASRKLSKYEKNYNTTEI